MTKRVKDITVQARVTREEKRQIERAAAEVGQTVSEWLRELATWESSPLTKPLHRNKAPLR